VEAWGVCALCRVRTNVIDVLPRAEPIGRPRLKGDEMYKTIVVPLDSSKRAESILPHVEELFAVKRGKLILLHVIEPTAFSPLAPASPARLSVMTPESYIQQVKKMHTHAEEYLASVQAALKERGIEAEALIEAGSAAERIVHVAEEREADLIAIASHGLTGLSRVFFGSVAAAVLNRSKTPLLLIRSVQDD